MSENGALFLAEGMVSREQLEEQLTAAGKLESYLGQVLLDATKITAQAVDEFLAKSCTVPAVDLRKVKISAKLARLVPASVAIAHRVVPIEKLGAVLCVATSAPNNPALVAEIRRQTGCLVKMVRCPDAQMQFLLGKLYPDKPIATEKTVLAQKPSAADVTDPEAAATSRWDMTHAEDGPVKPVQL